MCPTLFPALFMLPTEMIVAVLRYLDGKSLENVALTNKRLMEVCKGDPVLRKKICTHLIIEKEQARQEAVRAQLSNGNLRKEISNFLGKYGSKVVTVNTLGPNTIRIDSLPGIAGLGVLQNDTREASGMPLRRNSNKSRRKPYRNFRY